MDCFITKRALRRLALLAVLVILCIPAPVQGASIVVRKSAARPKYPGQVSFTLTADSPSKINKVILWYGFTTSLCEQPENRQSLKVEPGNTVNLAWEWELDGWDDYMLPGMELWWYWDIYDDAGNSLTTEKQTLVILESRYNWQQLNQNKVTVYWASGGKPFGDDLLDITGQSLERLARDIGVSAPGMIRLVVYPSEQEMRRALQHLPRWAGGVAFPRYNLVLTGIEPHGPAGWAKSVISHELAHLVIEEQGGNCGVEVLPLWLNEGLSQYAEGDQADQGRVDVMHALDTWKLPELKTLEERFPKDAGDARKAYSHSRMVVTFMLETYGKDKMARLLDLFKSVKTADAALREVYGLDTNGIDETWRASLGFGDAPATAFPTATPTRTPRPSATPRGTATSTVTATTVATMTLSPSLIPTVVNAATAPTATPTPAPAWKASFPILAVLGAGALAGAALTVLVVGGILVLYLKRK